MNISRPPHNWKVTPKQAIGIQKRLSPHICNAEPRKRLRYIAGVDAAYIHKLDRCIAGVVLWDLQDKRVLEKHTASSPTPFPYVPGLLTFREAPVVILALRKLIRKPDAIMCDGQGIAHPRRLGLASHIGLIADIPAIGCAKSRLCGRYREPAQKKGATSPLTDKGERIGSVVRTKDHTNLVFVSIGHKIDLATAEKIVLECAIGYRLPEPTRLADQLVRQAKKRFL